MIGAVDPWFRAETYLIYSLDPIEGESIFEIEEAFLQTTSLPYGLELELGHFFTEFGRQNPMHPHAWDWLDQPVVLSRFFGGDGMRAPGARLGWLAPLPWVGEFHVGLQNANGETMASFLASEEYAAERGVGGRPFAERDVRSLADLVWLLRTSHAVELSSETTLLGGLSAAFGPNSTGEDGSTRIYGADLALHWRAADDTRGWPFVRVQSEVLARRYQADAFFDAGDPTDPGDDITIPGDTLRDWGLYAQALWGFQPGWSAGLRYEFVTGSGTSYDPESGAAVRRSEDPFRADRQRVSPLLIWQPSEFSRIRLQYSFDDPDHLADDAHSVWLGFEFLIGAHPAHRAL